MRLPSFRHRGVLGLNARNLLYIRPFNPQKAVAFADDKLKTKAYLEARGVPVAKTYGRIDTRNQLRAFDFSILPEKFVLKPKYGFGGEGIIVIKGRTKHGDYLASGNRTYTQNDLFEHVEDILDGRFSINGKVDTAFFERLLVPHDCFTPFHPTGLPDIRIVVFNLVPVMAMLRIPTPESQGKANVHLGGVGIGIDIAKGVTTHATQYDKIVKTLPHGASPAGLSIPFWEEMLLIASKIQYQTNIGYLAVDLTIDAEQGPVLLEVNARAGLMVQIANLAPLRSRLERVQGVKVTTPEKGARLAQELFGEKIKRASIADERPVLGLQEILAVAGDGVHIDVPCLIAPEQERSTFDPRLLSELQDRGAIQSADGEGLYHIKWTLGGRKLQTVVREGAVGHPSIRAQIGRRDLSGFLIDPSKMASSTPVRTKVKDDLRAMDRLLSQFDKDLLLLKFVKPSNLLDERSRLLHDRRYNPLFQYKPIELDLHDMEARLLELQPDESPLGMLLSKKRDELLQRISLLHARGDARKFTDASRALYGAPTTELITSAREFLKQQICCDLPSNIVLSAVEAVPKFREILDNYGLSDWQVEARSALVADATVGGSKFYLREDATFSLDHIESLIAHEIEVHILTAKNGSLQPFSVFRQGTANYLDTQEGLAIYSQNRVLSANHPRRLSPARGVLALCFALEHSFADTREYLEEELGYTSDGAITKAITLKRGLYDTSEHGAFTKALVYYRGYTAVEQFVENGGDLSRLYIGKITLEDLELIEQVAGIKKPVLLPKWLRSSTD